MAAAPSNKELPVPEPAPIPLNEIPIVPIAQIGGKLLNGGELVNLVEYASRRADKFAATIATLEAGIAARAAEAAESLPKADFPREAQKQAAAKMGAKARAEVTQASDAARWETLKELNAAAESLALTASLYASPVVVLSRQGLGSPERSAYQMQVASAGPTELANLATFAIATQNRALGAALLSALDAMPARSRPFSAQELADKLCGDETRAILASVEAVRTANQRAINANRAFVRGRTDPLAAVTMALRKKKETT